MKLIILSVHVIVCLGLILIILLQRGKGADMGAVFGGSSQTVFGSSGATSFLHKVTTLAAIVFVLTSLSLSVFFGKRSAVSIMEGASKAPAAQTTEAPAPVPAPTGGEQNNP
ncbi:MAG: preprotein translocase subunit SecG [Deltaproteobacteria bacterium]|nr:preprotein translocase subunit SecG [Deltaproteobacteria bacterium]